MSNIDPLNPYSATPGQPVMAVAKPVSLTVFGIINLVFGILGICGIAGSGVQMFVLRNQPGIENPIFEIMQQNSIYFAFMIASLGLGSIATILLIIAGVGLLNGKPYGRSCSIFYAGYAIVSGIIGIGMNFVFLVQPMLENINDMADGPEKAGAIGGAIGGTLGGACGLIYPIILLIFMLRAPVINYMRTQQS